MDTQFNSQTKAFAIRVIDALGGTAEVARLCRINMAAVSQWKENGIPGYRLDFLRLARPDVFDGLDVDGGEQVRESKGPMNRMPPDASRELS